MFLEERVALLTLRIMGITVWRVGANCFSLSVENVHLECLEFSMCIGYLMCNRVLRFLIKGAESELFDEFRGFAEPEAVQLVCEHSIRLQDRGVEAHGLFKHKLSPLTCFDTFKRDIQPFYR